MDEELEDVVEILDEVENEVNEFEAEQQIHLESANVHQTFEDELIDSDPKNVVAITHSDHHYEHTNDIASYDENKNETVDLDNAEDKQDLKILEIDNTSENG